MKEEQILRTIQELSRSLPTFSDGRIDYSNSEIAPVATIFVKYEDQILLLKRSNKVSSYQGKWNTVAGYLDELKPVREKIMEELEEETGLGEEDISSMDFGTSYEFRDRDIGKKWIVCPVLVELTHKPEIRLDREHIEFTWINPEEIEEFDTVPNLKKSWTSLRTQ